MTTDTPEYHTKTLSPLSPLPIHPPEPSNIPVLRNQIDPDLNMISTFTELNPAHSAIASSNSFPEPIASASMNDSPSADSSFSDAYEQADGNEGNKDEIVNQGTEVSDDYAMTFDSDGEAHSDSQDVSQANIEQETMSLPAFVPAIHLPSSASHDAPVTDIPWNVQDANPTNTQPPPSHPTTFPAAANHSESSAGQAQIETAKSHPSTYEDIAIGGIDIQQLLDNITANAEKNEAASVITTPSSANASSLPRGLGLPTHASLPPRPQLPPKRFHDDVLKYHGGASNLPQTVNSYRAPGVNMPLVASGAPGTSTDPRSGLPPPPTASFRPPQSISSPTNPDPYTKINRLTTQDRMPKSIESTFEVDDADLRWEPEIQKKYDEFLVEERMFVTEGLWDRFPPNSRLFIGNLPSEKVTKRDIFHIFHKYGRLAQVAIKQAYGFVQFHDTAACYTALDREQGAEVRGKKMHLEISKPQKNTRNAQAGTAPLRRSRSPDYLRASISDRGSRQGQGRGLERYDSRSGPAYRKDEYGRPLRDDYRPGRSPSPPRATFRSRDDYAYARERGGRDSYDGLDRRRSRSRSPYGQRDSGRYRERSPSPRARQAHEDSDLQIPRREARDVPDVQIILMGQLDRGFVSWVEGELRGRGLKSEVMFLSPRLPLEAVIRRQILEGVHAVSQLDMRSQNSSKIPLQVFDRQAGANNVRFDEYQDLEPKIAAELVLRAKQTPVQTTSYAPPQPQYTPAQSYQPAAVTPTAPDLVNLVGQLDNATLQKLLGTMNAPQQNAPATAANSSIDLAGLLGGLQQPQLQQVYQQPVPVIPYTNPMTSFAPNGSASQQQGSQQSAQQVQNIMAQLAKFRQA